MTARHLWLLACGGALISAVVSAHDMPVEQRVEVTMHPQDDRLVVRMHIPTSVLGEVAIQAAAADAVRNLDIRQDETPLDAPAMTTTLSAETKSLDVELTYRIAAGASGISARLNGFQSTPMEPVRTTVRYQPATGREQIVSVTGPATRVGFDPGTLDAVQLFIAQGLRSGRPPPTTCCCSCAC